MKLVKLGLISVLVFGLLFWGITLLFPSNTVISRVTSIAGRSDSLAASIRNNEVSLQQLLAAGHADLRVQAADIPFYENNLFQPGAGAAMPDADTIFFRVNQRGKMVAEGGLAFYQLEADSTTTQLFYVFQTPWYNPLQKMKMMMADKAFGPGMDSTLLRLKRQR
ncbi:MAG: hypothetical protein MUF29_07770 [Chitinophagaceae bacterium]|jgi:hypothetical protein|nr:hypothetical protein [Chitinophagaceae bacterium]